MGAVFGDDVEQEGHQRRAVVWPTRRAVASMPLALPLRWGGAEAIRMLCWATGTVRIPRRRAPAAMRCRKAPGRRAGRPAGTVPRHGRKSCAAQKSGVDTFDEDAGDRGHDHDHGGPCGHQQSRGDFVVAEFVLQVEGQGHHGEHLSQKRADRR